MKFTFLPTTRSEMQARGFDAVDVLLISGDVYVDHPSFGVACLGRWFEREGYRVGIIAQPRWNDPSDFLRMGRPRLFVGISAGTVDSMINNYTANKRPRRDDMYSEGGRAFKENVRIRPDNATQVYTKLAREAFSHTPIVVGGTEASLRRLAHYDYWRNCVRPSILTEIDADLLVYGMGELPATAIARELSKASAAIGGGALSRAAPETQAALMKLRDERGIAYLCTREEARAIEPRLTLPAFEEVRDSKKKFAKAAYLIEYETSPFNGKRLVQAHRQSAVVVNPPSLPLSTEQFDSIYELPFTKMPHPSYRDKIPAAEMIRHSVAATRGCFGGCSFCAISLHQGRIVQSRSEKSVLNELQAMLGSKKFKGIVSDLGGPSANMYSMGCKSLAIQEKCRKLSCVHPKICPHLRKDHSALTGLLREARTLRGMRAVNVASGLRFDLALSDDRAGMAFLRELITHHVGGHLKIAPEHLDERVLMLMRKSGMKEFERFLALFERVSREAGKEQYVVPYFISGFPGCTHEQMKKVSDCLSRRNWKLQQVQAFIPTPMTIATAMYWSGMDPMTRQPLFVAKQWQDRKRQQAMLQPFRRRTRH